MSRTRSDRSREVPPRLLRSTTPGRRCAARCLPGVPCIPLSRLISRRWRPPRRDESVCRVAAMAYVWHQTPSTREYAVTATRTQATSRLPRRGRLRRRPHTRPSTVTDNDRHNTQPLHSTTRRVTAPALPASPAPPGTSARAQGPSSSNPKGTACLAAREDASPDESCAPPRASSV